MHTHLWSGVSFKLAEAEFFLDEMGKDLVHPRHRPESRGFAAVMESTGALVHHPWQPRLYYHLDAFLVATRSVPEIIQWNFGIDTRFQNKLKTWWEQLPADERQRRESFQQHFGPLYQQFRCLPLSQARNVTVHRKGEPPVEMQVNGRWGVYVGGPAQHVPGAESQPIVAGDDPALQWAATLPPTPVEPSPADFNLVLPQAGGTVHKEPLLATCAGYLQQARGVANQADQLRHAEHGDGLLTTPPVFD